MKSVCMIVFILLILAMGVIAGDSDGWSFVQIADTQLGFSSGNKDLSVEIDNFRKAVQYINRAKPAFVVISGDMINAPHNPKQIRAFWQVANEIDKDIPLHLVAGNHDISPVTERNINSYTRLFGPDHYSFSHGNASFIVLNSNLIKSSSSVPDLYDGQKKWFLDELEIANKKKLEHIFVLTHHAWFVNDPDEKDAYQNIPQALRQEYLNLMKQHGVDFALAGHLHHEAISKVENISFITTSALSKSLGKEPVGLRVFHINGNRVDHTYYTLDQLDLQGKK